MPDPTTMEFARAGTALIIRAKGPLEGYGAAWQDQVDAELEKVAGDVILNLSQATFIDSRGMGFVFDLHKRMNAGGRRLLLVVAGTVVREAFEAAGVTELLRLYNSERSATADILRDQTG